MKEQLIGFETAKLAKEKGFKELCFCYYSKEGLQFPYLENGSSTDTYFRVELDDLLEQHNNNYHNTFSAPTQSLLQKWLREKYSISIEITSKYYYSSREHLSWEYEINTKTGDDIADITSNFRSYEEALEKGIEQALKLIDIK